ncbi:transposable element Tc1 transposase [Trichonephila clavipes]|nr:transposable element Tc1 transposase [Trichonephila clavipes]
MEAIANIWQVIPVEGFQKLVESMPRHVAAIIKARGGTLYLPCNVHEIDNYGVGGLMVCAGIILDGRTPLHVFERGSVTGVRYNDEILEPYDCLFRRVIIFAIWIDQPGLQTSTHRACLGCFGEGNCNSQPPPRTIQEMKTVLQNEWDQLPQELINCLISSMISHCEAFIAAGHVIRMSEDRTTKKVFNAQPIGLLPIGWVGQILDGLMA